MGLLDDRRARSGLLADEYGLAHAGLLGQPNRRDVAAMQSRHNIVPDLMNWARQNPVEAGATAVSMSPFEPFATAADVGLSAKDVYDAVQKGDWRGAAISGGLGLASAALPFVGYGAIKRASNSLPPLSPEQERRVIDAANAAHRERLEFSAYRGGDEKFNLDRALEDAGLGVSDGRDFWYGAAPLNAPLPDDVMANAIDKDQWGGAAFEWGDVPPSALGEFTDGNGAGLDPFFSNTLRKDDFRLRLQNYDPDGEDGFGSLMIEPKDISSIERRALGLELSGGEVSALDDALAHQNHLARAAAFRRYLEESGVKFNDVTNHINSEYVYVPVDKGMDDMKIRFADHGNQSAFHPGADHNLADGDGASLDSIREALADALRRYSPEE